MELIVINERKLKVMLSDEEMTQYDLDTIDACPGADIHTSLRGMMGDEACLAVDQYLDEAVMNGCESVRLIHGKGTGALRTAIWKYLRGDRRIASFRIGRYGEGDGGVTVVELK